MIGGPDVWEIAMWLDDLQSESNPAARLAEESSLTRAQVDAALHYGSAYPDEIAARIDLHRRETTAAALR